MHKKKVMATAAIAIALGLGAAATAPNAMAATERPTSAPTATPLAARVVTPLAASGCAGDTCIQLNSPGVPSAGYSSAEGWLYSTTYFGRFRLTGPNGLVKYSGYQTWYGGGADNTFWAPAKFAAVVGQYCMTFYWTSQKSPYSVLGTEGEACESIE